MVNLERSLIVKGCRVIGRLHTIPYRSFRNEQSGPVGQGLCQLGNEFGRSPGGGKA